MARFSANEVMKDGLDHMALDVNMMTICEGEPTTYEQAHSNKGTGAGKVLAHKDTPTLTVAADASGFKVTATAAAGNTIDISGTADHIALVDTVGEKLWFVTTATSQALVAGGTVDIPLWKDNIKAPTAPA